MNKENFDNLFNYLASGDREIGKELMESDGYLCYLHFLDGNKSRIYFSTPEDNGVRGARILTIKVEERMHDDTIKFPKLNKYINSIQFLRDLSQMLAARDLSISFDDVSREVLTRLERLSQYRMFSLDSEDAPQRRIYIPGVALITFKWKEADDLSHVIEKAVRDRYTLDISSETNPCDSEDEEETGGE